MSYNKNLARSFAAGVVMLGASLAGIQGAGAAPANDAAAACQQEVTPGPSKGLFTDTRGECVNIAKFFAGSSDGNSFVSGVCGFDFNQVVTDTTNKGQCIKTLKGID